MKKLKTITKSLLGASLLLIFSLLSQSLSAQSNSSESRIISGKVLDRGDNSSLIGVNILAENSEQGTISDIDGSFTIKVPPESNTLIFSYTGYSDYRLNVNESSNDVVVYMTLNSELIDEIVVVGYGNQERTKVTGAIETVKGDELTEVATFTADQALQGRATGVMVMNNGSPGADPVLRIRGLSTTGDNSPLIVVDGVIVQGLGDLSPGDIESVTVLKDASTTAIFGAQGSNGVIMVTTKKGENREPTIELSTQVGTQLVTERFDVMNREQYLQHAANWGVAGDRINDPQYADLISHDTDWQDEIFQPGTFQNYNLAVSGAGENSNYRLSGAYINQEGVLLNTGTDRYNFRANSSFKKKKIEIGQNLAVSLVNRKPENTAGGRSALEHAIKMPPYFSVFNSSNIGGYQGVNNALDAQDAENPVRVLAHPQNKSQRTNILGSLYAQYEILEGLKFKVQSGLDYWIFENNNFTPSFSGEPTAVPFAVIGFGTGKHRQVTSFAQLNYLKSFGNHNFDFLLLGERNNSFDTRAGASSTNAITNEIDNLTNNDLQGGSFSFEYIRLGYLGRVNYDYQGKYLLAGSYRRDASTRFGSNNRWAGFYSVAGGWVISKEDFFPSDGAISYMKLRGSHGTVGNDKIGDYRYSASINTGSYFTSFVDALSGEAILGTGTTAGNVASPELKWETTKMTNVGADVYMFDNKLSLSGEYYRNLSDDLLINVQLTPSLGGHNGSGPRNVGSVLVDGFEFTLGYNEAEGPFKWNVDFNIGTTNNVVQSLGGEILTNGFFENASLLRSEEGLALNHFYGYVTDGIFQTEAEILTSPLQEGAQPGDIKFRDISGAEGVPDGVIDDLDKIILGSPIPDFTYGLNLGGEYKAFDFSLLFIGMQGNEIYNTNIWDLEGGRRFFNAGPQALDAWSESNTDTDIPRITTDPQNLLPSDRFVEDGSFTRLKNLTVGYTIPMERQGISKLRIYFSGQNLWTLTDYSGLDPEVGSSVLVGNNASQVGIDRGNYPLPKVFLGGVQIKF